MEKRGITTVMITVLVAVLILAIGLFYYFFFFGPPVEEAKCGLGIDWKILMVGGKEDICYLQTTKEIRFTLENGLATPLEGVYVKVEGEGDSKASLLDDSKMGKAEAFVGRIKFDISKDGPLNTLQLVPVVLVDDKKTACTDKALEKVSIETCS